MANLSFNSLFVVLPILFLDIDTIPSANPDPLSTAIYPEPPATSKPQSTGLELRIFEKPQPWSDSYSVDGQCFCDTNYDHGLRTISVNTPDGNKSVAEICIDIINRFGSGSTENRSYFNTVQCGHPPTNNAPDEKICPGVPQGVNDYTGNGCHHKGATWNLDKLYPKD